MIKKGKYKHYKGKYCEVIGCARHSETNDLLVIYKNLDDESNTGMEHLRARPYGLFI